MILLMSMKTNLGAMGADEHSENYPERGLRENVEFRRCYWAQHV